MFQILFSSREFTKLKKTSNNEKTYDYENKNTTTSWSLCNRHLYLESAS